jgi:hypothetical protein
MNKGIVIGITGFLVFTVGYMAWQIARPWI